MKRIKVVIFDCDGVMFDSRQANIHYYNHVLETFGLPPMTKNQVDFVHMHTASESISHIFMGTTLEEQALKYCKTLDYAPFISDMIMEPGLEELLKTLKPRYGLAVATNRSDTIGKLLDINGLSDFFDIVVSSLDVKNPKPHPESVFKILNHFSITAKHALYVGDSLVDWQTARAAGVDLVAYQNEALDTPWKVNSMCDMGKLLGVMDQCGV